MSLGRFDRETCEYVITTPKTPAPWINYVGTLAFGGFVDQAGASLLCRGDPSLNRIVYRPPNAAPGEFKGEAMYLRLTRGGRRETVCPHSIPAMTRLDSYECRVGAFWSRYVSRLRGLKYEATVFVPEGQDALVRIVRVMNEGDGPVSVDAIPVLAWSHFDAGKHLTNADWVPQTMMSEAELAGGGAAGGAGGRVILFQFPFMRRDGPVNFFASSAPASSFETRRDAFLGDGGYGSWAKPLSLEDDELPRGVAARGDNVAALMLRCGELPAGACYEFITIAGQADTREAARAAVGALSAPGAAEAELAKLREKDIARRAFLTVDTPEGNFSDIVNALAPRQCAVTREWSRYLSIYQTGYGSRGIGFRDSCQDLLAWIPQDKADAAEFLLLLLSFQRSDGSAWHQFNPLSREASGGDSDEMPDRPRYYGDDHLWAILAACAYIRETGDFSFLERVAPFRDTRAPAHQGDESAAGDRGTVRVHLERALGFSRRNIGAHGLPLLGFADWNDTVNLEAGAESCFCACLFGYAALELADVYRAMGEPASADALLEAHADMRASFGRAAWDGHWYAAYFRADGVAIGSRGTDGRIFSYAQSWPVIAGFAEPERARGAMDALGRLLDTERGSKLMWPCYERYDPSLGGVATYPPGAKENGGIFLHANPWAIIASCMLGDAESAWLRFKRINPLERQDEPERYRAEPYAFAQNVLGDDHPEFGLARNSWLTGTASWGWVAAVERILGIRPRADGLELNPRIPGSWSGFSARRVFRGTAFDIRAERGTGSRDVVSLDGDELPGYLVPVAMFKGKSSVAVTIRLAATDANAPPNSPPPR